MKARGGGTEFLMMSSFGMPLGGLTMLIAGERVFYSVEEGVVVRRT